MSPATIIRTGSHGDEAFYSPTGSGHMPEEGADVDEPESLLSEAPVHPVRSLQASFEESIIESTDDNEDPTSADSNAESRRQKLLEAKKYDESWQARWKLRATSRYHPLLKLISQIVFGLHLLQQQQAKSEGEVVKILQAHVNEVDSFLERAAQDFDLAISDIQERIRHLKLPMEHKEVFEVMLDDKKFRTQLLDGNDKIESIIDRTTKAMDASLYDLQQCVKANKELAKYLDGVRGEWPQEKRAISDVFSAMRGNENGWSRYITDLEGKAVTLRKNLAKLGSLLGEMSKMAAAASRRNTAQSRTSQGRSSSMGSKSAPTSPGLRSKFTDEAVPAMPSPDSRNGSSNNLNKPLPREPAKRATPADAVKPHPVPLAERFERPRQLPQSLESTAQTSNKENERPRTAGAVSSRKAREADSRANTAELAEFLKASNTPPNPAQSNPHFNPLRSNPPDDSWKNYNDTGRSQSQANLSNGSDSSHPRSKGQGGVDILKGAEEARAQMGMDSTSIRTSSDTADQKQTSLQGTGFARRLSKRMKHLPTQEEAAAAEAAAAAEQAGEQYPDSAYASGPDSKSSNEKKSRPESFLGPLPGGKGGMMMEPLYASTVTTPAERPNREAGRDGTNQSVRSLAPTSKSRGSTLKGMFQRKWSSGKRMFAT